MSTIFESMGGRYENKGDYILPSLKIADEKKYHIGIWGQRHRRYLKQYHRVRYYNLLTNGKLNEYLSEVDERANALFLRLVKELAEKENVTEKLKANDPMEWVRKMSNIRNQAMEIVNAEVIFI